MTQLFNITIDSIDVTERFINGSVSEAVNRIYDVATFTIDNSETVFEEREVVINYGSKTFTGFVYSIAKTGKNSIRVEARTYSAKLTEPYSPHETVVDDAETSHELCALYATQSGIPITITSESLDFGGSYERKGTMLSALLNIAAVTGAEYYNDSGTVKIVPNKPIETSGDEIPESDIFDFVADSSSVYNKGVGYITVQNGGDTSSDVISLNKIYAEVDECTGEIFVYPNPNGVLEHSVGISVLTATKLERKEEVALLDDDIVRLDCAVESILSVKLNGVSISSYNFEQGHNVLYFETLMRGTLEVTYTAYVYRGYTNIKQTPLGRFVTFDLYYLDQVLMFQGFLSKDCDNNVSTDGDMVCIVPSDMYYNQGFYAWTIGGVPEFHFYNKNIEIVRTVVTTSENYTSVENASLEETATGYRYKTRYDLDSALGARSAGVDISYTTSVDGDDYYFEFLQYYPKVQVSYGTAAKKHYVQFGEITDGEITMVIRNDNTGVTCEYDLEYKLPCALNQYVPIDVAGELSLQVSDIKGESLSYTKPDGTSGSVTIDDFGVVKIYVFMDGDYVIETGPLKLRTTITLTSNVAGV